MTILEAAVAVLRKQQAPLSAKEIHGQIISEGLYVFAAKDPVGVLRAAIRKGLKAGVGIELVGPDRYSFRGR